MFEIIFIDFERIANECDGLGNTSTWSVFNAREVSCDWRQAPEHKICPTLFIKSGESGWEVGWYF